MDAIVYGKKEKRIQIPVGTILGVIAVFLIFLWPLLSLFVEAFIREDVGFSLRNFAEVLGDANFGKVVINSILINTGATILTATIGVIAAYIMAYTDIPFKK